VATENALSDPFCHFPDSLSRLDFSHLAAWRAASVKPFMDARRTFCVLPAHTDPQKVPHDLQRSPVNTRWGGKVPNGFWHSG
jgi:hypothetical protein